MGIINQYYLYKFYFIFFQNKNDLIILKINKFFKLN